jgi:peptidoglycan/xylan/chitin deacetylase (PgdA/CDA1 family)
LLERYDVPATLFVVGGAIGRGDEFWWDQLQSLFVGDHPLPESLHLTLAGRRRSWRLSEQEAALPLSSRWTRTRLHRTLWNELRMLPASERFEAIETLGEWANRPMQMRRDRQVMNEAELLRMASGHHIEIGAHTTSHPRMSALDPAEQFAEVQRGKTRLEEILGRRVTSFSYPFGGRFDVSEASVDAVRRAGFVRACTMRHAMVRPRTNLLRLPRLAVGNWSGEEFERQMHSWLPS